MSVPLVPLADYMVVEQEAAQSKTVSGLYLPEKASSSYDAFFKGRLNRVYSIINTEILFFDFGFGGSANLNNGDLARQSSAALV